MSVYLGLGSNLGDRRANLARAIELLGMRGFEVEKVSPIVESPALLPAGAEEEWNRPYLNLALRGRCDKTPEQALVMMKAIEREMGRAQAPRWSPRMVDIDILFWEGVRKKSETLTLPHPGMAKRAFVLTPLLHLDPALLLPLAGGEKTVRELTREIRPIPLWMGIVNLTPDSFSDGGKWFDHKALEEHLGKLLKEGIQIVDIGAESTRPDASDIDPGHEWRQLQPVLEQVQDQCAADPLCPTVSVDTRNPATAARALENGADMINDVTGLDHPAMQEVVRTHDCEVVAMHSLTVPVQPQVIMPDEPDVVAQIGGWLEARLEAWDRAGIDIRRIIFDPGIGFGKSRSQNLELLRRAVEFKRYGLRLLVGHSRKSFMGVWTKRPFADRDPDTLGISMALCQQGVDIVRVHEPLLHLQAYRAWSHVEMQFAPVRPAASAELI